MTILNAIIRHVLTAAGGALVVDGTLSAADLQSVIGAVVTIATVAWSIWEKVQAKRGRPAA